MNLLITGPNKAARDIYSHRVSCVIAITKVMIGQSLMVIK